MELALVGSALIAAILIYYASKRYNLRELVSPALVFVVAFLALVFGYNQWEKYRFNPVQKGDDYVLTLSREGGGYSLPVYFNDKKVRGLVDTGATNIVIPYEFAESIGVDMANLNFNVPVSTANGNANVAYTTIGAMRVGETVTFNNVEVYVASQGSLDAPLLGLDFLKKAAGYAVSDGVMEIRFRQ